MKIDKPSSPQQTPASSPLAPTQASPSTSSLAPASQSRPASDTFQTAASGSSLQPASRSQASIQREIRTPSTAGSAPAAGDLEAARGGGPLAPAMTQSIQAGRNLSEGSRGEPARELQSLLNRAGIQPRLNEDGDFGRRTEANVREFQRRSGLTADGVVGPQTLAALERAAGGSPTAPTPPTRPTQPTAPTGPTAPTQPTAPTGPTAPTAPVSGSFATEPGRVSTSWDGSKAQREQQAEAILRSNGQWPPQDGRAYAIQIDQDAPPGEASRTDRSAYVRSYTGQTSVFRSENGRLVEVSGAPHRSASHPGQFSIGSNGVGTPDVNRDGRYDIAHIRPGVYDYSTRTNGNNRYNPLDNGQFRVARDTNQDGVISGGERSGNHSASGIQIHVGNSSSPSSVGCQTMPPSDYSNFQNALRRANTGNESSFTYILVRRPNDQFGANPF